MIAPITSDFKTEPQLVELQQQNRAEQILETCGPLMSCVEIFMIPFF